MPVEDDLAELLEDPRTRSRTGPAWPAALFRLMGVGVKGAAPRWPLTLGAGVGGTLLDTVLVRWRVFKGVPALPAPFGEGVE